jgi:hypothetical protein
MFDKASSWLATKSNAVRGSLLSPAKRIRSQARHRALYVSQGEVDPSILDEVRQRTRWRLSLSTSELIAELNQCFEATGDTPRAHGSCSLLLN